jgi:hypothetical protein
LRCWFQPANWIYKDGRDFLERFIKDEQNPHFGIKPDDFELLETIVEIFDSQKEYDLRTFELMMIYGEKQ